MLHLLDPCGVAGGVDTVAVEIDELHVVLRVVHRRDDLLLVRLRVRREAVAIPRQQTRLPDLGGVDLSIAVVVLDHRDRFLQRRLGNQHGPDQVIDRPVGYVDRVPIGARFELFDHHVSGTELGLDLRERVVRQTVHP